MTNSLPFDSAEPATALRQLPSGRAVFALYGTGADGVEAEPYIGVTPDLRRRLERLLKPAVGQTRRLQLVSRVRRIAWEQTGSEFESLLVQFRILDQVYGGKALERMHLRSPAFVRFHGSNPYPRLTVSNRVSLRESQWAFGPFASRTSAEHYADEVLKLFNLRRCYEDLDPNPSHPGCVYSEMKMCLAPCYQGCTDERYAQEADAVRSFLASRGESRLSALRAERARAAEDLEFEAAASLHVQYQRVEAVRALVPEMVQPLGSLRACVFQFAAENDQVAAFLFQDGEIRGPVPFSTLGMRIQNEQSGSSSLFAQPVAFEAVPEGGPVAGVKASRDALESRLEAVLEQLEGFRAAPSATTRQAHLALLARWYYRPAQKRVGEVCFPVEDGGGVGRWPLKAMLRGIGRIAAAALPKSSPVQLPVQLPV